MNLHELRQSGTKLIGAPFQIVRAQLALRGHAGALTRMAGGRPLIDGPGEVHIGRRGIINSRYAPVKFETEPGASITVGSNAVINFGTAIAAGQSVHIGDHVTIGPYCIIDDRERRSPTETHPRAIVIGDHTWLASRVVVESGCTIGCGTVIGAGTIVSEDVPDHVVYGGSPAQVIRAVE